MPPSSFQLTLSDGQQVLRKRSQVCLVEKAAAASAVDTIAEKMPHKSGLLRQLKSAEVDRAEVLRRKSVVNLDHFGYVGQSIFCSIVALRQKCLWFLFPSFFLNFRHVDPRTLEATDVKHC